MEETEKLKREILKYSPRAFENDITKVIDYIKPCERNLQLHLLSTALIVAQQNFDATTIMAALLHDKVELAPFNETIVRLVKGVRHIEATTKNKDTKDEIISKYILNNAEDLRSVVIKLASVLDKIRYPEDIKTEDKKVYLRQATSIYSEIAEYLDLGDIKTEIDEKVFEQTQPIEYAAITKKYEENHIDTDTLHNYLKFLNRITDGIDVKILGRIKSKYSVYNKLKKYEKEWKSPSLSSISDLVAFRCITKDTNACFDVLERLMDNAEIDLDEFEDYISSPKKNGYKAIHSIFTFPKISDIKTEVQTLTEDMDRTNTYGSASHIAYKASKSRYANPTDKYKWVEEVHTALNNNRKNREDIIDTPIDVNLFQEDIFAFTPKGQIIPLSKGDTALDFAFRIHSQIGNSAIAAKVNGKASKLSQTLETGDMVEIKTQKDKKSQDINTLSFVNSSSSRSKILRGVLKNRKN